MNPQTGTFTSMDTYPGSIFDPVSLHKYLYANADPVMNVDPSGYFTLGELSVRNVIDKILDSQTYKNYLKTYQKMKNVLNVVNIMCTIYDIGRQIMEAALDPDSTAEDIIRAAARGIVTGVFINLMCKIKGLGPVLTKIFIAAGDLKNGDEVYLIDGDSAVVTGSELEKPDEAIKVYNLEVEGYNTYFVGDYGVLVHNYNPSKSYPDQDIYVLYDRNGDIKYVGRSVDANTRVKQHGSSENRGFLKPKIVATGLPYEAGRGKEQIGIERFGTKNKKYNNQINGVNPDGKWYDTFKKAGEVYAFLFDEILK